MNDRESALISARAAYVAAYTDRRVWADTTFGISHAAPISFEEFKNFAVTVWWSAHRTEPLYVSRIKELPSWIQYGELQDVAAAARWAIPPADALGRPRTGELAGTTGPVAYIDVHDEGLLRLVALHEIAHLFCDTLDTITGHDTRWAAVYEDLIGRHLGVPLAALWRVEFDGWTNKAAQKIADDPDWLAVMLDRTELPPSPRLNRHRPGTRNIGGRDGNSTQSSRKRRNEETLRPSAIVDTPPPALGQARHHFQVNTRTALVASTAISPCCRR